MLLNEAMKVILSANSRDVVMDTLEISSPLISSWLHSDKERIATFKLAVKIFGYYDIVIYPYSESDLRDKWIEYKENLN